MLVVNAARKEADLAHLRPNLGREVAIEPQFERALLALQGPAAAAVLARLAAGGVERMPFMSAAEMTIAGAPCFVTRSGYTGEDGFEIVARGRRTRSRSPKRCSPSRRSRRSGSARATRCGSKPGCASTATTSTRPRPRSRPVSPGRSASAAATTAVFPAPRRSCGSWPRGRARKRVGIRPDGRAPAREGTAITDPAGNPIGRVTSGGFGPSVGAPIAMGYVDAAHAAEGSGAGAGRARRAAAGAGRATAVRPDPLLPRLTRTRSGGNE